MVGERIEMTTINDLNKSISDMTSDELFERLKDIRKNRRIKKKPALTTKTSKIALASADKLLESMSQEQINSLISKLGG